jgi:hypothetical protein
MSHGGARRGAGRPKMRSADRREILNITINPKVLKAFRKAVPIGRRARFVEDAIMLKLRFDQAGQGSLDPSEGIL